MLTIAFLLNGLITLACLYAAWQIWQIRRALASAADVLSEAERATHNVLHGAPQAIRQGQMGTYELKQRYRQLMPKLQQAQQALAVLSLVQGFWWRRQRQSLEQISRRRTGKRRYGG